jgi:fructosamine-3-kinase
VNVPISGLADVPADIVGDALTIRRLAGGTNHQTCLVTRADGSLLVLKTTPHLAVDVFDTEAEGLAALGRTGAVAAPRVIAVGSTFLALEALNPAPPLDDVAFWARTGQALALMHSQRGERFGWHRDNWLGLLRQTNTWTIDCYEFFVRHRILRYLPEPAVMAVLDAGDRAAIESICRRLPELVPPTFPALTHGDLWHGNVLATVDESPALIDPAVSWSWPEVDLSMMLHGQAPQSFFDGYHDVLPPESGWRDHLALLNLRELLSVLAHGDLLPDAASWAGPQVRALIQRFR